MNLCDYPTQLQRRIGHLVRTVNYKSPNFQQIDQNDDTRDGLTSFLGRARHVRCSMTSPIYALRPQILH